MIRTSVSVSVVLLSLATVTAGLASCGGEPKSALIMKPPPAAGYQLSIQNVSRFTAGVPGQPPATGKLTTEFLLVVRSQEVYENGNIAARVEIRKAAIHLLSPFVTPAIQGREFGVVLTPLGKSIAFSGTEDLRRRIADQLPADDELAKSNQTREGIIGQFSDAAWAALLDSALNVWPPTPVSPGDEWARDRLYDPRSDNFITTTFRLESVNQSSARIKFDSMVEPGNDFGSRMRGEIHGDIRVSPSEGAVQSILSTGRVEGKSISHDQDVSIDTRTTVEVVLL